MLASKQYDLEHAKAPAPVASSGIRIKSLALHGFKSFPRSTTFEFDTGITAIIGPNGSGKSNIADAMRWVLGEQSYSNLRGRKAEDVIFSGSTARSPVGMAEVTLTLDNSSGGLPVDFQEVSITRRAYRSGENQYLINGARVRLKDVNQITASLGQSHTVIGQGLVDAALSQRPEERRGLFEHAAGITGLRLKYAATARHLSEAEANSTRLDDLLAELEPRLRTLERQATQAREYAAVQHELRETALRYFSTLWREHRSALESLEHDVNESELALQDAMQYVADAEKSVEQVDSELARIRGRSSDLQERLATARNHQRDLEHQIELTRQREEALNGELARQEAARDELQAEATRVREQSDSRISEREAVRRELAGIENKLTQVQSARSVLDEAINSLVTQCERVDAEREAFRQRQYQMRAQHEYSQRQREDLESRIASIEERGQALESELLETEINIDQLSGERRRLEQVLISRRSETEQVDDKLKSHRQEIEALRRQMETLEGDRASRAARLDALQRLQESGEGLHRGVQSVMKAARSGHLDGIVGTLAGQITVPHDLETAIEAALGGHLQDVIVRAWGDAEAAIDHLKKTNAGRATFQPLDSVRHHGGSDRPPIGSQPGVRGFAIELVHFDDQLAPVMQTLLGRVAITHDLDATRRVLGKLRSGWTAVTLEGEVSRSGGSVTGGSRVRQSGTLTRERELREIPDELAEIDSRRRELRTEIEQAEATHQKLESSLELARSALRECVNLIDDAERRHSAMEDRREQIRDGLAHNEDERTRTKSQIEATSSDIERLLAQIEQAEGSLEELERSREELTSEIVRLRSTGDDGELRRLETERTRLIERDRGLDRTLESLADRASRIDGDIARYDQRLSESTESISQLGAELKRLTESREAACGQVRCLMQELDPLDNLQTSMNEQLTVQRRDIMDLQRKYRDLERTRDRHRFDMQRQEADGDLLLERAADVLDEGDPEALLAHHPVEDDVDHNALEMELHRLRQRSRRIGAFGEETITQFEQEQERYTFLRSQLDDVQRGAEALQRMLGELDRSMSLEFDRTFGQVAQAFEVTFRRLFGGGQARLIRTDDDDSVGIDIVAQPPGKRLQSLALLSGGERALTAAALLFAILRVNPSPFCLLDEVDAALDEANVVRFRDELRDLSSQTQFVVVTHNRATIEGADVLYGITMGADAVSRVVSLKLPPEP